MDCDLVIVGAGPVGGVLALHAAQAGFEVCLVGPGPDAEVPEDIRNYALVLGSWRLLSAVGLARTLEKRAEPLHGLQAEDGSASGGVSRASVLLDEADLRTREDGEAMGRMVQASHLADALEKALKKQKGIHRERARFLDRWVEGDKVSVLLDNGVTLTTPLLVGSDGVNSAVRAAAGIRTRKWAYRQSVIAAHVKLPAPHHGLARQVFTPEGAFALLPLQGDRANTAWYMDTEAAEALMAYPLDAIEAELNARFAGWAGGAMRMEGPILSYPLQFCLAEAVVAERTVLVGDAVRRISPIAGQGLNSGLKDVAALVEIMDDARRVGLDWGRAEFLDRYQRWRRFDSAAVALAMDALMRGFSTRERVTGMLRGALMRGVQRVSPIRRAMASQAGSAQDSLPKVMQG